MALCLSSTRTIVTSSCRVRNSRSISSSSSSSSAAAVVAATTTSSPTTKQQQQQQNLSLIAPTATATTKPGARRTSTTKKTTIICRAPTTTTSSRGFDGVRQTTGRNCLTASRTHASLAGIVQPTIGAIVPTTSSTILSSSSLYDRPIVDVVVKNSCYNGTTTTATTTNHHNEYLFLLASAAAMFVSYSSIHYFVGATTPGATTTAADAATIGSRGSSSGGGGGGGAPGGGSPSTRSTYSSSSSSSEDTAKTKAEEEVRKWDERTRRHPYMVSDSAIQGQRWTMEDRYTVANGGHFAAVYDGHGGDAVSEILRDRLHSLYVKALPLRHMEEKQQRLHDVSFTVPSIRSHITALRGALKRIERDVLRQDELEYQGSTAVIVIVHVDENGQRSLVSANIGDSRAVLSRGGKAVDLTRDHKPSDEREMARIVAMGEEVEWDPYGEIHRVRDLSLSRAIGDRFAKPVVTSEAEIDCTTVIDDEDEFFILASDGLWDVMTSQEVVNFVRDHMKGTPAAYPDMGIEEKRRKMARMLATEALERGSADNVCVVLVWLQHK